LKKKKTKTKDEDFLGKRIFLPLQELANNGGFGHCKSIVNFPSTVISQLIRFLATIHKPPTLDYLLKWVLKKKRNSFFFVPKLLKLGGSH
jgi:hypothetical protein